LGKRSTQITRPNHFHAEKTAEAGKVQKFRIQKKRSPNPPQTPPAQFQKSRGCPSTKRIPSTTKFKDKRGIKDHKDQVKIGIPNPN